MDDRLDLAGRRLPRDQQAALDRGFAVAGGAVLLGDSTTKQCYDILGFLGALNTLASGGGVTDPHAGALNTTLGRTEFRNLGVYAQGTYKINDQFKLTGGLRYTSDRETNTSTQVSTQFGYPISLTTFQPLPVTIASVACTNPLAPRRPARRTTR